MRPAELVRFVGIKGGVNAAIDHRGAGGARRPAHFVATQGVPRVDTDADDVARLNGGEVEKFEGFVSQNGVARIRGRSRREHK